MPKVDVRPLSLAELERRLRDYESAYSLPSEALALAFRDGQVLETADLRRWSLLYRTWLAATRAD